MCELIVRSAMFGHVNRLCMTCAHYSCMDINTFVHNKFCAVSPIKP